MVAIQMLRLEYKSVSNRNDSFIAHDSKTFTISTTHQVSMIKEWKQDLDARRDQARNKLVVGEDNYEIRHDQAVVEMITTEIPTSPVKMSNNVVPPVTTTMATSLPKKSDTVKKFTLNRQQTFAFMIITGHLDGDSAVHDGRRRFF